MKFPTKEDFHDKDDIPDEVLAKDLSDTELEIERLRWLQENIGKVREAFVVLGFARSLTTLELVSLDVDIGNRIMFCDCLKELQRLRREECPA